MDKKVGILSMQKVINYGSFLQAYALKQLLLKAGAKEVEFIDIIPGRNLLDNRKNSFKTFNKLKNIVSKLFKYSPNAIKKRISFQKRLPISITSSWKEEGIGEPLQNKVFDLVVIGSDEVFNCCQNTKWGYTTQLFGDIENAKKIISYAGSFGHTTYKDLKKYGIDKEVALHLNSLEEISVRDKNSSEVIEKLLDKKPLLHIDPVLAYDFSEKLNEEFKHSDKDYILIYSYQGRIKNKEEINAIKNFATKHKKKLYSLVSFYSWCDKVIVPDSPFEVLLWFKHADYIITDTFHGTIFSIINHKEFVTLVRDSNFNKLSFLLNQLGLGNRIVKHSSELNSIIVNKIDYDKIENILNALRQNSFQYLQHHLNE